MNTLETEIVAGLLDTLHRAANEADHAHIEQVMTEIEAFGAIVLGENAFDPEYQAYVRHSANGQVPRALAIDEGRGNQFTVRVQ